MSYSIVEGCIRQTLDLPIEEDMRDEILVEEKILKNRKNPLYVVTSIHSEAINNMARKKSLDEVDLQCLKDLGFAVAYNKLDKDGNKCYIKHNARTFKEYMDRKKN